MGGNYGGEGGLAILIILIMEFIFTLAIPFLIGFLSACFLLVSLLANKKGKLYLKAKGIRVIISVLIASVVGYGTFLLLNGFFGSISTSLIKSLS